MNDVKIHEEEMVGENKTTFYCNTISYVRDYMSTSKGFLMDFTVRANNGSLLTNSLFVFLLGGNKVIPVLEKGFIELDVDLAAVLQVFELICSNKVVSDPFSNVSFQITKIMEDI